MHRSLVICLLAACAGPSDPPPPQGDGHDQIDGPLEGHEEQGTLLLGNQLDGLGTDPAYYPSATTAGTTAEGRSVEVRVTGSAALAVGKHVGIDPELDGLVLADSQGGEFRVTPVRGGTDLAFYTLEHRAVGETTWKDACGGGDAVPFFGRWTRTGLHEADAGSISFACTGAVAWKCSVWGYLAGTDENARGWNLHQACTRMARGDYCGDGTPHTRDGTEITIYDRDGIGLPVPARFPGVQHWAPDPERYFFEAAWNSGPRGASCLGRVRWQSLALGDACGGGDVLPDPRTSTSARFCDDVDFQSDPDPPLLFNTSHYSDLGIDEWVSGDDHLVTVAGYFDGSETTPDRFPYNDRTYVHVGRDALILRAPLDPNNPDLVPLHAYDNGHDRTAGRTPATPLPATYDDLGWEGFAHRTYHEGMVELWLYRNPTTGDTVATTHAPPAPYIEKGFLGYLLPAE